LRVNVAVDEIGKLIVETKSANPLPPISDSLHIDHGPNDRYLCLPLRFVDDPFAVLKPRKLSQPKSGE
jgi:hypothetical protein